MQLSLQELIEVGAHYGHITRKWNPKMAPYIFGKRNGIHIIDLQQTIPLFEKACNAIKEVASNNGRILFVGTKFQASDLVKEAAVKCGQYYVNHKWRGGMLTNWKTIRQSIDRMKKLEATISNPVGLTKKEVGLLQKTLDNLERDLGGIRDLGNCPDLLIIIDTNREATALKEAVKLNIPIVAIVDSDSCPDHVNFPIPGNDDATKSIELYCNNFAQAVLEGLQKGLAKSGIDIGASEDVLKLKEENDEAKNKQPKKPKTDKKFNGERKFKAVKRKDENESSSNKEGDK